VELSNEFEVKAPIERAWEILTDVERIAPCLPGAQLQEIEGDEFRGIVKVKVGPITAQYKGKATFVEKDDVNKKAVLKADGRDTRGAGNAAATITAQLEPHGEVTRVSVNTDLHVTGKVAQFGRGVMADVSAKLMTQFADNLGQLMLSDGAPAEAAPEAAPVAEPAAEATPETAPAASAAAEAPKVRRIDAPEPQPVNLLDTAGAPVAKRAVPAVGLLLLLLIIWRVLRSKK
jgi:carbon monoxide dehydrogenase subunit G